MGVGWLGKAGAVDFMTPEMIATLPLGDILNDTEPRPVDGISGRYTVDIPESWRVMYAFGGVTMMTAIRAATTEIAIVGAPELKLVSAHATFCSAVPCGPVGIQVEVLRSGRTGAQAQVRLWALDPESPDPTGPVRNDLVLTVVMALHRESPLEFTGTSAPEVPAPLQCPGRDDFEDNPFLSIPYHLQTEFRPAIGGLPTGEVRPPADPESATWFRFQKSPMLSGGTWEPSALAVPGDILGSAVHTGVGSEAGFFFVVSLQISLAWFSDVGTEWVLQHTRAQKAGNGFATGTAELFDEDRRLVAMATQTALLRPMSAPG